MVSENLYGELTSVDDTGILQDANLPGFIEDQQNPAFSAGPLWEYFECSTYNGYPIADDALNLPIESLDMLNAALEPVMNNTSEIFRVSPDDTKGLERYNELLKRQDAREIMIIDETRQFDVSGLSYIVWVKYCTIMYKLNPRFNYLRDEVNICQ